MEAAKKQNNSDKECQEQTIVELRKDNAMLKGEMDELRHVVQVLSNANEDAKPKEAERQDAERQETERKEVERRAQVESPIKPGPQHPEPPPPHAQADTFPIGQPRSLGPLRTEGSIPATVEGSPPEVGGIPVKTAMDASAANRNTGFPSMFSGTGAAATEQATASTGYKKFGTSDPWADYMKKSAQYNFSDDPLFKGSFNQEAKQNKEDCKDEGPASQVRTPQEQDLGEFIKRALLEGFKGAKSKDQDKPKAKEADKTDLPECPSPDRCRAWRAAVREAIRSASDDPDAAFAWVLEVYAVREDKAKVCSELADTGKFRTLDTKLLAALTKVAKGELAQQILNYKESEAQQSRIDRGRQVLLMFEVHFKTSEEACALYGTEDLLKVSPDSDDLKAFLRKWESVLTGMSHVPDPATLKDLSYREVRKSRKLRFDLDVYERASEGSSDRSYEFLINSVRRYLDRERLRTNREKSLNRIQLSMQTQHHMTNADEAQVMANEVRRVTTAINAMSSPKLASVSMEANASTHTTLALVPAPLAGSRLVLVVLVQVVALLSGQADLGAHRDRLPVAVLEIHQEAQVRAENLKSHAGSLPRAIAKGVTNSTQTWRHGNAGPTQTKPISRS